MGSILFAKTITQNSATIEWKTDEVSTSFVEFWIKGEIPGKQGNADFVRNHNVKITGLTENTEYFYKIISVDNSPNKNAIEVKGLDSPFHTLAKKDEAPNSPMGDYCLADGAFTVLSMSDE